MSISPPEKRYNITWAYIAGFVDCDGWITYGKVAVHNGKAYYRIDVAMTQKKTREEPMRAIHDFLVSHGISAKWIVRKQAAPPHGLQIDIIVGERQSVITLLENIIPYMVLKKDLAKKRLSKVREQEADRLRYRPTQDDVDLPEPSGNQYWTDEEVETLKRMNDEGYNNVAIAHELQRTLNSVQRKKYKLGVLSPNYGRDPSENAEENEETQQESK